MCERAYFYSARLVVLWDAAKPWQTSPVLCSCRGVLQAAHPGHDLLCPRNFWAVGNWPPCETGVTDFQWKSWGAGSCWFVMMALSVFLLNALNWCPTLKLLGDLHLIFCIWKRSDKKKATFFPRPPVETSNSNKLGYSPVPLLDGTNRSGRLSLVRDFLFQLRTPELLTALALEREQSSGCIPSPEQHQPLAHQCPCLWELLSRAMKRCLKVTSVTSHYTGNNTFGMVTVVGCFLTILIFNFILWVFLIERVWHD